MQCELNTVVDLPSWDQDTVLNTTHMINCKPGGPLNPIYCSGRYLGPIADGCPMLSVEFAPFLDLIVAVWQATRERGGPSNRSLFKV